MVVDSKIRTEMEVQGDSQKETREGNSDSSVNGTNLTRI